jgi:dynein heavy chain
MCSTVPQKWTSVVWVIFSRGSRHQVSVSPLRDFIAHRCVTGAGRAGAWGCFDEFNRLAPEVLSVCSVQFKSVCDGIRAGAANVIVEGDTVALDVTCGVFITMNPGYLGRSELPEGLRALFRPITVMVPDMVLICENMMMAEGFENASTLATKFFGLYALCRELLSAQVKLAARSQT